MLTPFQLSGLIHWQEVTNSMQKRKGRKPKDVGGLKNLFRNTHVPWPSEVKPKRSQRKHWRKIFDL